MKRTADDDQRHLRWVSGCACLELPSARIGMQGVGLAASLVVRPTSLRNRFASRGSAAV